MNGTNMCTFIHRHEIPANKRPTYVRIVSDYREQKQDPYQVRCTVGGDRIDFHGDVATKVADLVTVKCLINHIISTPGAKAACIDIKDFYLNNPLPKAEYIRFQADLVPHDIWEQYDLQRFCDNGALYARVDKGMYGLPQAGRVANDHLLPRLQEAGYTATGQTPGLFSQKDNDIVFALVVDDFLIHHTSDQALTHLIDTLQQHYTITVD